MSSPRLRLLALAASVAVATAAADGPPAAGLAGSAPAKNLSMRLFTPQGYHQMNLQGNEARSVSSDRIDIVDMNIAVFSGDATARIDSVILSPAASFFLHESRASGDGAVRLIDYRNNFEVTGEQWVYENTLKKISIARNVRVTIHAALPDLLK